MSRLGLTPRGLFAVAAIIGSILGFAVTTAGRGQYVAFICRTGLIENVTDLAMTALVETSVNEGLTTF